jgi:hypothetical protein
MSHLRLTSFLPWKHRQMYVIFLFPLVFSVLAVFQFLWGDSSLGTKIAVAVLVLTSIALQFVPPLPELVHFLVPLGLQLIVCGWWYFANLMESL